MVVVVVAIPLSVACALACVALWLCGFWGIYQWWENEIATRKPGQRPRLRDWVFAETVVRRRHGGNLDGGERQFRVDRLLKETTGLGVEDLWLEIKRRSKEARDNGNQDPLAEKVRISWKLCDA